MKIVSWNCNDLGGKSNIEVIKTVVRKDKISLILIQETKMGEEESKEVMKKNWKHGEGISIGSVGLCGDYAPSWTREGSPKWRFGEIPVG